MSTVLERMERQAVLLERQNRWDDIDFLIEHESLQWRERKRELYRDRVPQASFVTGTNVELIYASTAPGTAKNTFTAEAQINDTAGMGVQAHLPADFFLPAKGEIGRGLSIRARGILGTTGSPTFTWTIRSGVSGSTAAAILLGTAAATAGATVTTKQWELEGEIILEAIGAAGANSTVRGAGLVTSPAGLASPFAAELWGGAAQPGTVATFDTSIVNYINFNVACGTSNVLNTITLLQLLVFGLN